MSHHHLAVGSTPVGGLAGVSKAQAGSQQRPQASRCIAVLAYAAGAQGKGLQKGNKTRG